MLLFIVWLLDAALDAVGVYVVEAHNSVEACLIGEGLAEADATPYEWTTAEPSQAKDIGLIAQGSCSVADPWIAHNARVGSCRCEGGECAYCTSDPVADQQEADEAAFDAAYDRWYEAGMPLR